MAAPRSEGDVMDIGSAWTHRSPRRLVEGRSHGHGPVASADVA